MGCIKEADLGFTRKEINVLLTEVDMDNDGKISYDEFVPLCFTLLVEMVSESLVEAPQEEEELSAFLLDLFGSAANEDGLLTHRDVLALLKQADMGLTRIQMHAIMSEADEEDGMIRYDVLGKAVAGMVFTLVNVEMQRDRSKQSKNHRESEGYGVILGMNQETMGDALFATFSSGASLLSLSDISAGIDGALEGISERQKKAVMSVAQDYMNEQGDVPYEVVCQNAFPVLVWLDEQDRLAGGSQ